MSEPTTEPTLVTLKNKDAGVQPWKVWLPAGVSPDTFVEGYADAGWSIDDTADDETAGPAPLDVVKSTPDATNGGTTDGDDPNVDDDTPHPSPYAN